MTKFFKYFQYVYIIFAAFLTYRGFVEYGNNTNMAYMLWAIAALILFTYFFRRRYISKFEQRNNERDSK